MADIETINMKNSKIMVNLSLTKDEYKLLKQSTKRLLLLPSSITILSELLTTGKLGNSNRIMLPKKILSKNKITKLIKKVPAQVFDFDDEKFLLIKLQESKIGKPDFGEEK